MTALLRDLRYGLRLLIKYKTSTTVALLSLALGIGGNIAVFNLINALLLREVPVRAPQRLVYISRVSPDHGKSTMFSYPTYQELERNQSAFSALAAYLGDDMLTVEANGVLTAVSVMVVSGNFYSALGVPAAVGRTISTEDEKFGEGAAAVAVISHRWWRQRFGSDPEIVGKSIKIDGAPFTIVGVAPEPFFGLGTGVTQDVTVPLSARPLFRTIKLDDRKRSWLRIIGRMKDDVSLEQAQAQLETLWPNVQLPTMAPALTAEEQQRFLSYRLSLDSAARGQVGWRRSLSQPLLTLWALVGLLLLIACVNVANLQLARVVERRHELAVRTALGARPSSLVRQILAETLLLSLPAAGLGLLFAYPASRVLAAFVWPGFGEISLDLYPDPRVFSFTVAAALGTAMLFGAAPAWQAAGRNAAGVLQEETRALAGRRRVGGWFVSIQVALTITLLIGTGLFLRSLDKLRDLPLGFRTEGVLLVQLFPQPRGYERPNRAQYYRELSQQLSGVPGVQATSFHKFGPVATYTDTRQEVVSAVGSDSNAAESSGADRHVIAPGFFETLGMSILTGRDFTWSDNESGAAIVILSSSLAKQLFPSGNPVGGRVSIGSNPEFRDLEVVGIASDASLYNVRVEKSRAVYIPFFREPKLWEGPVAVLRVQGDPSTVGPVVKQRIEALGYEYPFQMERLTEQIDRLLRNERLAAMVSGFVGALALVLAGIGLYGVMSRAVVSRTREIGLRTALGAQPGNVLWMVFREAIALVLIGLAIGIPCALMSTQLIAKLLFGLSPNDSTTVIGVTLILLAVGSLAGYLPARRAARMDPLVALRDE